MAFCISKAKSTCILFDRGRVDDTERIRAYLDKTEGISLTVLPIICSSPPLPAGIDITINETQRLDPDGPGFVCFTSGTTGHSKGVVIRRLCLTSSPLCKLGDAVISYNESQWLGGTKSVIDGVLTGKKVFALAYPASIEDVLEVFQNHRITYFAFNVALLRGMKWILLGDMPLTPEDRERFAFYFSGLSEFLCLGGLFEKPVIDFWEQVIGRPLQNRYGATELAGLPTLGISKIYVSTMYISLIAFLPTDLWERVLWEDLLPASRRSYRREHMEVCPSRVPTGFYSKTCQPPALPRAFRHHRSDKD